MKLKRYGLPYMGSKSRIAPKIINLLPSADKLYDVFAGGCAITHAALLSGKWDKVIANDITDAPKLFEDEFAPYDVTAEIYALCVNEEVRKQGYATALMDKAEEIARKNGHKAVYLYWSQLEAPRWVLDWYYRRGYEAVGFSKHKIELIKKLV